MIWIKWPDWAGPDCSDRKRKGFAIKFFLVVSLTASSMMPTRVARKYLLEPWFRRQVEIQLAGKYDQKEGPGRLLSVCSSVP